MGGTNFEIISEFCSQIFANSLAFFGNFFCQGKLHDIGQEKVMTSSPGFFSLGAAAAAGQTRLNALHTYWQI